MVEDQGFRVVEFPGFLNNLEGAGAVVRLFKQEMVDLGVLNFASWIEGGAILRVFNELRHMPFILWAFGNINQTLTITGLIEATSNLVKTGKEFSLVLGPPSSLLTQKQISASIKTISIIRSLQRTNIGMIGYNCPGMIDSTVDEIWKNIPDNRANGLAATLESSVKNIRANKKDLLESVRLYFAMKQVVESHSLDAFAIRCWPELKDNSLRLDMTPCFAISKLGDEGIVGSCESDISLAVTMLLLQELTGNPPVGLDYNTFDASKNSLAFWHCGSNACSLADTKDGIELRKPSSGGLRELSSGMSVEFGVKQGKATLAKLMREYDKMLISSGNFISPSPMFRGGIAEISLDSPVFEFLTKIVQEGFEHHVCMVHGDVKEELLKICELLKIDPVVIA